MVPFLRAGHILYCQSSELLLCNSILNHFLYPYRGWSFLVPAFVMVLVGIMMFLFLVVGRCLCIIIKILAKEI